MTKLSVNINKVATIRNARGGNNPDLIKVATDCERFGAEGITVHPRPDERHIRYSDVRNLKPILTTEFNIEGNPNDDFIRLGAFLKADITKGLTLNADYTYNAEFYNYKAAYIPLDGWNSWGGKIDNKVQYVTTSRLEQNSSQNKSFALNIYGNYKFDLLENHHFNLMLGGNAESGNYFSHYSQRDNLLDPKMPEFSLAMGTTQIVSGSHSHWATAGYFGRLNYDYKNIWLLELNGRYDGSSSFPANSRWAFFPSASLGYRISEQEFFSPLKTYISNAKFRASFGEIGNQAVGDNQYLPVLTSNTVNWLLANGDRAVAYNMPKLVASTLKWERIQTLDFGGDFGFFNNDLNVSFDW